MPPPSIIEDNYTYVRDCEEMPEFKGYGPQHEHALKKHIADAIAGAVTLELAGEYVMEALNEARIISYSDNNTLALLTQTGRAFAVLIEYPESYIRDVASKMGVLENTAQRAMTKLLEQSFRAANIGLINEMAILCQKLDLDIWEVIEAAKTKPYGYMPFYPGPGLGGHCIPVDPRYLEWKLETLNSESKYIKVSEEINFSMPQYVVDRAKEIISKNKLENKITIIGATYKKDVSDIRESPAIDIMQILHDEKIPFNYNDPYIHEIKLSNKTYYSESINNLNNNQILGIIVTDHSSYNWSELSENFKFIFDTRNALRNFNKQDVNIFKL